MIWRLWCWILNICPKCEQILVPGFPTNHWPVSKCDLAKSAREAGR